MRLNTNKCSKCADCCPRAAVRLEGGLNIDSETCTECMLCVSECPLGGFDINPKDFYFILSKLRKAPRPVLGCNIRENLDAHAHSFCLGFLSEEHLLALMVFLKAPLQLNLTECKSCKNGFIVEVLQKRLESVLHAARYTLNKITLVEDRSALQYQDIPCDRRGFFNMMKKITMESASTFIDSSAEQEKTQFSEKALPPRRKLLNKAYSVIPPSSKKPESGIRNPEYSDSGLLELLKNYYYDIKVADDCDMCFACIGMCPTGALKSNFDIHSGDNNSAYHHEETEKQELFFFSSLCTGCGLCSDFCVNNSISIKQGFPGEDPFRVKCVKTVTPDEEEHDTVDEEEHKIVENDK